MFQKTPFSERGCYSLQPKKCNSFLCLPNNKRKKKQQSVATWNVVFFFPPEKPFWSFYFFSCVCPFPPSPSLSPTPHGEFCLLYQATLLAASSPARAPKSRQTKQARGHWTRKSKHSTTLNHSSIPPPLLTSIDNKKAFIKENLLNLVFSYRLNN